MPGIGRPIGTSKIRELRIRRPSRLQGRHLILRFLPYSRKIDNSGSFIVIFFTTKASTLISVEGCKALSPSLNDKIPFKYLITFFRHYDVLVKTRSKKTMAIMFSHQNDVGSCAGALLRMAKILFLQSASSENLKLSNLVSSRPRRFRMCVTSPVKLVGEISRSVSSHIWSLG